MRVYLTDGWELFGTSDMSAEEIQDNNKRAERFTAGNIYWTAVPPKSVHAKDEDCAGHIVDGTCTICGVWHGSKCPDCGGHGYHANGCPMF